MNPDLILGFFFLACWAFLLGSIYFWPSIYVSRFGSRKGHPHADAIIILNILLGWTFVGWVVALVWGATYKPKVNDENGGRG